MNDNDLALCALIERCALRDQAALRELYDRSCSFLNGIAYRILWSDDLSNEVLQEAFIQIWENSASYQRDKSKPMTWMASIVRYRAIDRLQVESKHSQRPGQEQESEILEQTPDKDTPDSHLAQHELSEQIHDCLSHLNEKVRQSIELAYLYGYSREELAEKFESRINTVKSWLHRGSERLKQCLETKLQITS